MLNKLLIILLMLFSLNSYATEKYNNLYEKNTKIELLPQSLNIREPFTALAIANFEIKNNTQNSVKIKKISSSQARHVDIYEKTVNEFGAEQLKRAKDIAIGPKTITSFKNKKYQVLLTGLKRKFAVDEEVELIIELEHLGTFKTYLPVIANYK